MKKIAAEVQDRLRRKTISIVDYIFRLREGRKMTLTQMAEKMGVKVNYLSRILSGTGSNVTLETIVKCEDALDADVLVCPGEYEEHLIDNPERLWLIFSTALKTESAPHLIHKIRCDQGLKYQAFLYDIPGIGKPITFSQSAPLPLKQEDAKMLGEIKIESKQNA